MSNVVKIQREKVIDLFSDVDGWDMETLISYVQDNLKDFYSGWTNEELLNELNQRGDLEPGKYNPLDIEEDYDLIHIAPSIEKKVISQKKLEKIERDFIQQIRYDLSTGDHTAISEMLRLLLNDENSSKIVLAYLPE